MTPIRTLLFIIASLNFNVSYGQTSKGADIIKLVSVLQIQETMKGVVNQIFLQYRRQKPNVPNQVWLEIESNIDYNTYLQNVNMIFEENYSKDEVKNLLTEALSNTKEIPLLKNKVQQQLYEEGRRFGFTNGNKIKETLKLKGY